jgi:hypothetical protein
MKKMLLSSFLAVALLSAGSASAGSNEADARELFTRFISAQNEHDANAVKSMLLDSPEMLLFSRGIETRGAAAVAERFKEYYLGTWHLEPDMAKFRTVAISANVVQILVPIVFTRGLPDTQPQSDTFLISQTYVKGDDGWRVAAILPVANTQITKPAQ